MLGPPRVLGRLALGAATLGLLATLVGAAPPTVGRPAAGSPAGSLLEPRVCTDDGEFTCAGLSVPQDRSGGAPTEDLWLDVVVSNNVDAPRGTLLFLTGGPGQPGLELLPKITERISYLLGDYRIVLIDQRGTGPDGINCPKLQAEVGSSDLAAPSPEAVRECADLIGPARNFYTTADTVADLEDLRRALGVPNWTIDGVSYGSFVAVRYALAHPGRVTKLVLDSVVPQDGAPALATDSMRRAEYVLRQACREQSCGYDPAADLATTINRHGRAVEILNLLVTASIVDPKLVGEAFHPVLTLLHQAAGGQPQPLLWTLDSLRGGDDTAFSAFSVGLHAATLCADLADLPWGDPSAPSTDRDAAIRRAVGRVPAGDVWPFPRQTAGEQGLLATCRHWPPARPNPAPPGHPLTVPALLLAGDRDLSTPLPWAQRQAALMPRARLVVIAGMGHSVQGRHPDADAAVKRFLLDPAS